MNGRDPMKGRHGVGVQRVNTGKTRPGQSEPASNKFKTNAKPQYSKKAPLVPDAKDTSAQAQIMIKEAPAPFKNNQTTVNLPTGMGPKGAKPGDENKPGGIYAGRRGNAVGQSNPPGRPVGQSKMPNQRFQIGGRTSVASTPRRRGDNGSGYPSKRNAAFYGE